jgi:hypothetical protein
VLATPASAAPPFGATLTLDPPSGKAGTTVNATFEVNQGTGNCRLRVTYRWDGREIGQDRTNDCTSSIRFKAPRSLGSHLLTAADSTTHLSAFATFTVTTVDGSPDPTPTKTRGQATPSGGQSANADPLPIDTGQQAQPSLAPAHADAGPQVKTSSSLSGWVLAFGGALILGGVVILILILLRLRGGGDPEDDRAPLTDFPTQQIPVGHLASLDDHGHSARSGPDYGRHAQ